MQRIKQARAVRRRGVARELPWWRMTPEQRAIATALIQAGRGPSGRFAPLQQESTA